MAKKRGASDSDSDSVKKRQISNPSTPLDSKQERNILNEGLLSLYNRDKKIKKDELRDSQSVNDSPSGALMNSNSKPNEIESSKTPSRARKVERSKNTITLKHPTTKFSDVGGMDHILKELLEMCMHMKFPSLHKELCIPPVRGILLHGPPGCGKTLLARALAGELGLPMLEVAATELVCGISGESESKIRETFDLTLKSGRCILFIDEIDAISPKRQTTDKLMERRLVSQLLKCFDDLNEKDPSFNVKVLAATSTPDSIDPSLRGGGRFDEEVAIGMPNEQARLRILTVLSDKAKLSPDFDLHWIAHNTPGYVGADLRNLASKAVRVGYSRMYGELLNSDFIQKQRSLLLKDPESVENSEAKPTDEVTLDDLIWLKSLDIPNEEFKNLHLKLEDFQVALKGCVPYSKREGFASVPDVTWSDIGALDDVKKQLRSTILWPVKFNKFYEANHISSTKGILLYGPKGCGKTLLAKAIANECSINFLSVNGPELLSMYVGESEKAVRRCFERARNSAPCVIFFDEIDALCPSRTISNVNAAVERVVNQLLTEMDGVQERKQVFVVAATNRLERIDSAMLRPGRLEKIIFVDLPSPAGRVEILTSLTKNKTHPHIIDDLALETIAFDERCENFSGADLAYLVREATTKAIEEIMDSSSVLNDLIIEKKHFDLALEIVKPSFNDQDRKHFKKSSLHLSNV